MANLRDIKKRIESVKNTQQITKAMYMVSAAKLRRAEEAIKASYPYSEKFKKMMSSIFARITVAEHPLLTVREPQNVLIIGIASDRGLCGSFNNNVLKSINNFINENNYNFKGIAIGKKVRDFLKKKNIETIKQIEGVRTADYNLIGDISKSICNLYREEKIDRVYLVYNHFISAISQKIVFDQLLPVEQENLETDEYVVDYLTEPSLNALLDVIIPQYVSNEIYTAWIDSIASEHAARMTSMDNATKNAGEMIDKLTLLFNRVRQATITKELMEIIGGKEALES
jgi:F-type H+-transporting ATPase subunit gamma